MNKEITTTRLNLSDVTVNAEKLSSEVNDVYKEVTETSNAIDQTTVGLLVS